ncbi:hypothetical protein EVAR_2738_1 [Eumeta japonica]|uniref:Uncharacterized protein n=1 Tax=Eumeta variegata TaxID=151549 RepID=A0A4C1T0B1_EUMVA|nr:hypothetical protein EVAR_2738_1 [Eumeta japonica]
MKSKRLNCGNGVCDQLRQFPGGAYVDLGWEKSALILSDCRETPRIDVTFCELFMLYEKLSCVLPSRAYSVRVFPHSFDRKNSMRRDIKSGGFPVELPSVTSSLGCRMLLNQSDRSFQFTCGCSEVSVNRSLRGAAQPRLSLFKNQQPPLRARLSVGASYHAQLYYFLSVVFPASPRVAFSADYCKSFFFANVRPRETS